MRNLYWTSMYFKASDKKMWFNAAAIGDTVTLKDLFAQNPKIVALHNKNSNYSAIFYSIKNRHLESTIYLNNIGLKFTQDDLRRIIANSSNPISDYQFCIELNKALGISSLNQEDFESMVFSALKNVCFSKNDLDSLEKLMKVADRNNWGQLLSEYRESKRYSTNPKTKQFMRDITLKYLLED